MEISHDILHDIVVFRLKVTVNKAGGRCGRMKIYMTHLEIVRLKLPYKSIDRPRHLNFA